MWEPLPLIVYGYAIHPLTPSRRDTRLSGRNRLSTVTETSTDDLFFHRDVVSLEVGDEVYAFEKYTPRPVEPVEGVWYRGYVVCTTRRPPVSWAVPDPAVPSSNKQPVKAEEPQQVFIGIFPASHIFVRDELADAEGRLPDLASSLSRAPSSMNGISSSHSISDAVSYTRVSSRLGMDILREEDEDAYTSRRSFRLGPPPDQANSSRAGLPVYPASIRSSSPLDSQIMKPLPPRPSLKSGDDTASGAAQPIIDEIASALREWHALMFQYLARRDYKLFRIVKEHIEALHLGRRQLLAQTLSTEETVNMRRDCVTRLVMGNLVQGLDVIVRHPTWGGLVNVDVQDDIDPRSWVSAVRMYAMQTSLAYLNIANEEGRLHTTASSLDSVISSSLSPSHSAFPDIPPHVHTLSQASIVSGATARSPMVRFYHVFLDVRNVVASPCSPGETAELFFSLYKKQGTQFVTEEFCSILTHDGVQARTPTRHIRTLFTDLTPSDVADPIYLVCRIVRNGALKSGSYPGSLASSEPNRRTSAASSRIDEKMLWNGTDFNNVADPTFQCRRPFGCSVLELSQLSKMVAEHSDVSPLKEHTMQIYVPTNEISFSMIHQNIINNNVKEFERSQRADTLAVSIKVFRGDSETIVRENMSLLQDVPRTLRLGFPDVVFPGDVRNELYIKLWCGDFGSSSGAGSRLSVVNLARGQMGTSWNNVQVTVEVRDQMGLTIQNVISQGSGEPLVTQFHSMVFLRCNEPTFGELIKIQLPLEGRPQWHLFFTFRNRGGRDRSGTRASPDLADRPFAFAFQPLFPDQHAFLEDGSRMLITYRADKLAQILPDLYLSSPSSLPSGLKDPILIPPEMSRLAPPLRDTLTIRSSLCSTRFTQNSILLHLLNWERLGDKDLLQTVLAKFVFVGEAEIVKFLRNIFDSLFGILMSSNNSNGEMDHLVFNALITVLGIVQDRRFINFQPVLDVYINTHFNCAAASSHIVRSLNHLLANPTASETASSLRAALKVWDYIFKFITRSRELQKVKELSMGGGVTAEHLELTFKRDLQTYLSEVTRMMSISSSPSIIGTQTIALQHFTSVLPELAKIFPIIELVSIVTTFANAVTTGKGKIIIWKLIMYLQIVKGFLFDNVQSRTLLVEAVVMWIKPHFGRYDEYVHTQTHDTEAVREAARTSWLESIRICVTIVAVMLDKLQTKLVSPDVIVDRQAYRAEQTNIEYLLSLLPRLLDAYMEFQNPGSIKILERSPISSKSQIPITFPESYPFPLLVPLPDATQGSTNTPLQGDETAWNPALGETAIVLLALVLSAPKKHILDFLESSLEIEGREQLVLLLSRFFSVASSILENDAFPKTWLNVNILAHKVLIKMMDPISAMMEKEFIPPQEHESQFDTNLWKECLSMLLKLLSSDQLIIEEFSPQKRRAVWRLAGDIRGEGATILLTLWQALGWTEHVPTNSEPAIKYGGYQAYLHSLVGHVVNLCLSHHDQLRNNAVQVLFSMIVSEYHQSGHFDKIENELVTRLDSLFMSDSKGDDISRTFFIGQLRHLFFEASDVDEQLRERVSRFLDSVDLFLELLLSVRALPEGEEFADDRVIATLRLMNFIRRIGRDEIYIKYVHQLVNMHLQSQNYVEAALTLKLHSDLHNWDLNAFVGPMEELGLPQQSQFHRKETLCLLIIDYLGKGKAWERAIDICKDLAYQHSEVTFNYTRLADILRHQAALLEHIVTSQRYYPDYYRVSFFGNFPAAIRDKRFIYRGYEWEKFGAFCERMLNKHPGAQLLKTAGEPLVDVRFGNQQYIQCTAVTPEPDRNRLIFTNPDVPLSVRTYYEHSAVNLFYSSRQIKKTARDGIEETWLEKTFYTTEEAFPTVLRRSEVVAVEVIEMSPIEIALTEVEEKTKELAALNMKYQTLAKTSQLVSTNALAMSLNTAVDAPAHTGIASYRQTFFGPDYAARYPDRADIIEKLKASIDEQVRVIDSSLKLHGHLCPPEFIPFHETLEKFFKKNFSEEIRRLAVDDLSNSLSPSLEVPESAYSSSLYEQSLRRTASTNSTTRGKYALPPLNLGHPTTAPVSYPSHSPTSNLPPQKQTPLQRHLAHLARHGINGLSSAPGENPASDSLSAESPRNSFVNVGSSVGVTQVSGASVVNSHVGSLGSFGSLKGRLSRFGSLNFGRRSNNTS